MIDKIRGDLVLSLSKGMMHQLGNLANGIGVNLQILSKMGLKTNHSETFFNRMLGYGQSFNEMITWMRGLFFNEGESFSEHFLSKVKEFTQFLWVNEKKCEVEVLWDEIKSHSFFFLIPVLITQEFFCENPCKKILAKEVEPHNLAMYFEPFGPSSKTIDYLSAKNISFSIQNQALYIKETS